MLLDSCYLRIVDDIGHNIEVAVTDQNWICKHERRQEIDVLSVTKIVRRKIVVAVAVRAVIIANRRFFAVACGVLKYFPDHGFFFRKSQASLTFFRASSATAFRCGLSMY